MLFTHTFEKMPLANCFHINPIPCDIKSFCVNSHVDCVNEWVMNGCVNEWIVNGCGNDCVISEFFF